jgi:hypothetical protein
MPQYSNELSGALFKNAKEGGNENWPDYRGSCEINGVQYWIDSWIKTPKKGGDKFMSLRFKPKQASEVEGGTKNPPAQPAAAGKDDFDDTEIPF